MRFKEFYLTEMPIVKTITLGPDSEMDEKLIYRYNFFKDGKVLDSFTKDGIKYVLFDGSSTLWFFLDGEVPVGFSGFRGLDEDKFNFVRLGTLYITKKYRNKGIATNLYTHLIEKYGGIISDYELSKNKNFGSFYVYEKLSKKYNVYEDYYGELTKIEDIKNLNLKKRSVLIVSKKELK